MGRILGFFGNRVLRAVCSGFEDNLDVVAGILTVCIQTRTLSLRKRHENSTIERNNKTYQRGRRVGLGRLLDLGRTKVVCSDVG